MAANINSTPANAEINSQIPQNIKPKITIKINNIIISIPSLPFVIGGDKIEINIRTIPTFLVRMRS